jgi:hypothetical protein
VTVAVTVAVNVAVTVTVTEVVNTEIVEIVDSAQSSDQNTPFFAVIKRLLGIKLPPVGGNLIFAGLFSVAQMSGAWPA